MFKRLTKMLRIAGADMSQLYKSYTIYSFSYFRTQTLQILNFISFHIMIKQLFIRTQFSNLPFTYILKFEVLECKFYSFIFRPYTLFQIPTFMILRIIGRSERKL